MEAGEGTSLTALTQDPAIKYSMAKPKQTEGRRDGNTSGSLAQYRCP